jgi:hypothetical protein
VRAGVDQSIGLRFPAGGETPLNLALMRLIDEAFRETPW